MIQLNTRPGVRGCVLRGLIVVCTVGLLTASASAKDVPQRLDVRVSATTRLASFVTSAHGGPIVVELPPGRSEVQPMDFLIQHGHLFGVTDANSQTVVTKADTDLLGYTHTTYAQVHRGVTVFGGVLKVHQDAGGQIIAANGDFFPAAFKVDTAPTVESAMAGQIATAAIVGAEPEVVHLELVIVDPGWYGDPPLGARLAYYVIVMDRDRTIPLREAFFVDAHTGTILDRWSMIHTIQGRSIHDLNNSGGQLPGPRKRFEEQPPTGIVSVDTAYDYAGDTRDYYWRAHGHVGIDGVSEDIIATVRLGGGICPNAFWNGRQVVFCDGVLTDDVFGHEITHGVTEFTAGLIYQNQSGQLNESFSDVFGELVDLFNGNVAFAGEPGGTPWPTPPDYVSSPGSDTPNDARDEFCLPNSVRWLVGEDATAFGGAIRDMWNPPCLGGGDPDTANSPLYVQVCDPGSDSGGVHTGSGVTNHAFAMLTDGKTFNGYTVNGIGPIKSGAVWYRALSQYLTPISDFQDAYAAFNQAAADLIGTFPNDPRTGLPSDSMFTAADANEVNNALLAVELDTPGICGYSVDALDAFQPAACGPQTVIFDDDFETGLNGWTVSNSSPPTPYDWVQTFGLPLGRPGRAWFCEDRNIGDCGLQDESGLHSLFSPAILLPDNLVFPTLRFSHYLLTEPRVDGGNLKVRVDGGAWTLVPAEAFTHNDYNSMLGGAQPLTQQPGFSGGTSQWGTSVVDLRGLVSGGQVLELRFDFGKDGCTGYTGWYLDDVRIYDCPASLDCNSNGLPDDAEVADGPRPDVVLDQAPAPLAIGAEPADADGLGTSRAEDFALSHTVSIESVTIWGIYHPTNTPETDDFTVVFHRDVAGKPGTGQDVISFDPNVVSTRVQTGQQQQGLFDEWELTLKLSIPVRLEPGKYFVQIYNNTAGGSDVFQWATVYGERPQHVMAHQTPGVNWLVTVFDLAIRINGPTIGADCDADGVPDECALAAGTATDCEPNGILDECEYADCNTNGQHDGCDISADPGIDCEPNGVPDVCEYADCNTNSVHDGCDISSQASTDCGLNGIPDECELVDCNTNAVHDTCEILADASRDCNVNGVLDDCEMTDCNTNGVLDSCDIVAGTSPDCQLNGVPDECELVDCNTNGVLDSCDISAGTSTDCGLNGVPDECEPADCNTNGEPDACDLSTGASLDCNTNAVPDECDLNSGTSPDVNANGVPDECDECLDSAFCDDGQFCSGTESCVGGRCQGGSNPCTNSGQPLCDEDADQCVQCFANADCDDGVFCNGPETCVNQTCVDGADACPGQVCNEGDDTCSALPDCVADADCDDGSFCNGAERCAGGSCQVGTDPCTDPSLSHCDEAQDACAQCFQDADCDDLQIATVDACVEQVCVYSAVTDFDLDGVDNEDDVCPNTPQGEAVDDAGCACHQLDDDGDGVSNCDDQCPDTPRGQGVAADGCIGKPPPAQPVPGLDGDDEPSPAAGLATYGNSCAECHGAPALDNGVAGAPDLAGATSALIQATLTGGEHSGGSADELDADAGDFADLAAFLEEDGGGEGEGEGAAETPGSDVGPGQEVEPGADVPADEPEDAGLAQGGTARPRTSGRNGSTCGMLGLMNLVVLLTGLVSAKRRRAKVPTR